MNINEIMVKVVDLLMVTTVLTLAIDVAKWSFTGQMSDNSQNIAVRLIDSIVDIPIRVLYALLNLVLKVVESILKALVGFISKKAAESIDFGTLEYKK